MNTESYLHYLIDLIHVDLTDDTRTPVEPPLANRCHLIRHGLSCSSFGGNRCLAGEETTHLSGEKNDLNSVEVLIGCLAIEYYGGTLSLNLATYRGVEDARQHLTALHWVRPEGRPRPISFVRSRSLSRAVSA